MAPKAKVVKSKATRSKALLPAKALAEIIAGLTRGTTIPDIIKAVKKAEEADIAATLAVALVAATTTKDVSTNAMDDIGGKMIPYFETNTGINFKALSIFGHMAFSVCPADKSAFFREQKKTYRSKINEAEDLWKMKDYFKTDATGAVIPAAAASKSKKIPETDRNIILTEIKNSHAFTDELREETRVALEDVWVYFDESLGEEEESEEEEEAMDTSATVSRAPAAVPAISSSSFVVPPIPPMLSSSSARATPSPIIEEPITYISSSSSMPPPKDVDTGKRKGSKAAKNA